MLVKLQRYQEAIVPFQKFIEVAPPQYAFKVKMAKAFINQFKGGFDKSVEISPQDAETWTNKGLLFFNSGRYQEALECYDKAIKINPIYPQTWYYRGTLLHILGKYKEAMESFQKFIEIAPPEHYCQIKMAKGVIRHFKESRKIV